jgi:RHS repeat-associated protein
LRTLLVITCRISDSIKGRKGDNKFVPFLYPGQYVDVETGLAYNRFRYYDVESGNYLSQDPIGLMGNNPTFYGYVSNSVTQLDLQPRFVAHETFPPRLLGRRTAKIFDNTITRFVWEGNVLLHEWQYNVADPPLAQASRLCQ